MGGKSKVPIALRLIPILFPKVEAIAPSLARRFFVYLFFKPLRYKLPQKELEVAASGHQHSGVIGGKRIQFYSWGEEGRPVVLLVHGWAGRATQFRKFIPNLLGAGFRVVAFDGPAHGNSEGNKTNLEEFRSVIEYCCSKQDQIVAAITHSFGGGAMLYTISKGLKFKIVINIGTPTIGDLIINTYLNAVNGSQETGNYFRNYVKKVTGRPFDDYTTMGFIDKVPQDLNLLLIHDTDDKEAPIENATELAKVFPVELMITTGLGHTRILKDQAVIERAVTFIRSRSSGS